MDDLDVFERSPFEDQMTHFVGDDCAPDGHRSETAPTSVATIRAPGGEQMTVRDVAEAMGVRVDDIPDSHEPALELPHALIYPSQENGTGRGHVVIRQANGDLSCICWPALRSKRGCHAMVAARELLGDPPVLEE